MSMISVLIEGVLNSLSIFILHLKFCRTLQSGPELLPVTTSDLPVVVEVGVLSFACWEVYNW